MKIGLNRTTLVFVGFSTIAGYLLWSEHAAHIKLAIPYLPYLLLLACPLLHLFMHGGHGHGHGAITHDEEDIQSRHQEQLPKGHSSIPDSGKNDD